MYGTASAIRIRPNPPSLASATALPSVKFLPTNFRRMLPVWQPGVCPRWTATMESGFRPFNTQDHRCEYDRLAQSLKATSVWV